MELRGWSVLVVKAMANPDETSRMAVIETAKGRVRVPHDLKSTKYTSLVYTYQQNQMNSNYEGNRRSTLKRHSQLQGKLRLYGASGSPHAGRHKYLTRRMN